MMTDQAQGAPDQRPERPYVGVRPFERNEREIFFGRDRDARFICDKVFASRLTLLYAPSGTGKSSILRTLVMPALESQHARTVYYDAWSAGSPLEALKDELVSLATRSGIPAAGAGAPTLAELIALLNSADDRTVVLILDQFEELLVPSNARWLAQFRRELGQLVRSGGPDVRVVLSLREEHLAALEPFREDIVQLFQSTYRLDALGPEDLRRAIQGPTKVFGVEWEPVLVDCLLNDLGSSGPGELFELDGENDTPNPAELSRRLADQPRHAVELPMLQLVCDQMWSARRNAAQLTVSLYERLGGAKKILDEYVRSVMPSTVEGRLFTARIMQVLAPPSGFKASYTVADLADNRGLPPARVAAELDRLAALHILRTRRYRSGVLYELQHDALIGIIGAWRDEVLARDRERRAQRRRRRRWVAAVLVCFIAFMVKPALTRIERYQRVDAPIEALRESLEKLIGAAVVPGANKPGSEPDLNLIRREIIQDTFSRKKELRVEAVRAIEEATTFLLHGTSGPWGQNDLRDLLERSEELFPPGYGISTPAGDSHIELDEREAIWPLIFDYPSARTIDRPYFTHVWRAVARHLAEERGLPVPEQIGLRANPDYPRNLGKLWGPGFGTSFAPPAHGMDGMSLELMEDPKAILISTFTLSPEAREFLHGSCAPVLVGRTMSSGRDAWYAVPRWSLPVWVSSGAPVFDGSGLPALQIALKLMESPEHLLSPAAVELLLRRAGRELPQTVAEARAARGDRLRDDLVTVVKTTSLDNLQWILDVAATCPTCDSTAIAARLSGESPITYALRGPWEPAERKAMPARFEESIKGFQQTTRWLPPLKKPARCFVAADLQDVLLKDGEPRPELRERLSQVQDALYLQYGVEAPEVTFSVSPSLPSGAFRLEFLDENPGQSGWPLPRTTREHALDQLSSAYEGRARELRHRLLTADSVSKALRTLEERHPATSDWIRQTYSVTDVKELLRAVIRPDPTGPANGQAGGAGGETVIHQDWLLRSLVFWSRVEQRDLEALAQRLRQTQQARVQEMWRAAPPRRGPVARDIARGILALETGNLPLAEKMFSKALQADRDDAIQVFLVEFSRYMAKQVWQEISTACSRPMRARPEGEKRRLRLMLADHLERASASSPNTRQLLLCQFATVPADREAERHRLAVRLTKEYPDPGQWPVWDAAAFGQQVLAIVDARADEKTLGAAGRRFVLNAFRRYSVSDAERLFRRVIDSCRRQSPQHSCPDLLHDMARARPERKIPYDWLTARGDGECPDDFSETLELARRAERNIEEPAGPERDRALEPIQLAKAKAYLCSADLGHEERRAEGERLARLLLGSRDLGGRAHGILAESRAARGSDREANQLLDSALARWPDEPYLGWAQLSVALRSGELEKVAQLSSDVLGLSSGATLGDAQLDRLYVASLSQILTQTGEWKLTAARLVGSRHRDRRLISLLLYARLGQEEGRKQRVLEDVWEQIKPEKWGERLEGRDAEVWYEMLVGYYLGKVERKRIFAPLASDAALEASELRHLGRPRRVLYCEAHFYDAMLAGARGDVDGKRRALKVVEEGCAGRFEHGMARYVSAQDSSRSRSAPPGR